MQSLQCKRGTERWKGIIVTVEKVENAHEGNSSGIKKEEKFHR